MPEDGIRLIPYENVLRLEELAALTERFVRLFGINKVRLTGGEPLVRKNIEGLVKMLAGIPGLDDLAITTNGTLLVEKSDALSDAGLKRINVSLDSLDPNKYGAITGGGNLAQVMKGLQAAREAGLGPIKINAVLLPGFDEEIHYVEWANREGFLVRFIELMPHFHGSSWNFKDEGPKVEQIVNNLTRRFGEVREMSRSVKSPGKHIHRYRIPDRDWTFAAIPGVSTPFCGDCNRLRIDCQGTLRLCLYGDQTMELGPLLEVSDEEFAGEIENFVAGKTDRTLDHIGSSMRAIGG